MRPVIAHCYQRSLAARAMSAVGQLTDQVHAGWLSAVGSKAYFPRPTCDKMRRTMAPPVGLPDTSHIHIEELGCATLFDHYAKSLAG
jgi:hypothetical protein